MQSKYLKGWQAVYVSDGLLLISFLSYSIPNMLALVTLIIAIIVGINNIAKKRTNKLGFDMAMTVVGVILYCIISSAAYSVAFQK